MALFAGGRAERPGAIAEALRHSRSAIAAAAAASCAISLLALTGSLYAMKIYTAVVPARDFSALGSLTLAMVLLYATSGVLDALRFKLLSRAAARLDRDLSGKAFAAQHAVSLGSCNVDAAQPIHDLEQIRVFLASSALIALFELPYMPLYLIANFLLSPL